MPLFREALSALPPDELADPRKRAKWFTHKPPTRATADKTIDHIFLAKGKWRVADVSVVRPPTWPSDHAPILAALDASTRRRRQSSPARRR